MKRDLRNADVRKEKEKKMMKIYLASLIKGV